MFNFFKNLINKYRDASIVKRRNGLNIQLDKKFEDIDSLEQYHQRIFQRGKVTNNNIEKRRIVAEIARIRGDIRRQNTSARVISAQINILNTNLHNRWLAKQTQIVPLPNIEELTAGSVEAEESLTALQEMNDDVESMSKKMFETASIGSEEEDAILAELNGSPVETLLRTVEDRIVAKTDDEKVRKKKSKFNSIGPMDTDTSNHRSLASEE